MLLPICDYLLASTSANPADAPQLSAPVVEVLLGVGAILGGGILVLTFAKLWMDVMGKRAATTVNIQAHAEGDAKETLPSRATVIDVTGFVATKDFEAHKEEARIRAVGLEKQISESRHEWAKELQSVLQAATLRDELTEEWRGEMSQDVKQTALKLAAVEKQADMIQIALQNQNLKLDRLIERHIPQHT